MLLLAVCAALLGLYMSMEPTANRGLSPLDAVPADAAAILETSDAASIWHDLCGQSAIWKELMANDFYFRINAYGQLLDSALLQSPQLGAYLANRQIIISAHALPDGFGYLAVLETDPSISQKDLLSSFTTFFQVSESASVSEVHGVEIHAFTSRFADKSIYFFVQNGLAVVSMSEALASSAALALKDQNSVLQNISFRRARETRGSDARAQIYVRYDGLAGIVKAYADKAQHAHPFFRESWAEWSALDADLTSDAVSLRGFAVGAEGSGISKFAKADPAPLTLPEFMPAKTAWFTWMGFSGYSSFREIILHNHAGDTTVSHVSKLCKCPADSLAISWIGNEVAAFTTEPASTDYPEERFIAIHSSDPFRAWNQLTELAERLAAESETEIARESYDEVELLHIPMGKLYGAMLGAAFDGVIDPWCFADGEIVYFGQSPAALRRLIIALRTGKSLALNETFAGVKQQVSGNAHFLMYSSPARSVNVYSHLLDSAFAEAVQANAPVYRNLKSFIYEVTHFKENLYFNNVYLGHNPAALNESNSIWEAELSSQVTLPPVLVTNHLTGTLETIVQDDNGHLYLFSESGNLLWEIEVDGPVMGKVEQVDIYKNGKLQLLFNTDKSLYLIDRNGSMVAPFPVRLPGRPVNGVAAIDYDNNRDYRFFVGVTGGYILVFDEKGKEVRGWEFRDSEADITEEIRHIRIKSKDYIMAINENGKVHLLDRQGKKRHSVGGNLQGLAEGAWYLEKSQTHIAACALYYADTLGAMYRFRFDGRFDRFDMGRGRPVDYLFADLSGSGVPDCIALWPDAAEAIDFNGKVRWTYLVEEGDGKSITTLALSPKTNGIGIATTGPSQVTVLYQDGKPIANSPFYGGMAPVSGDLGKNGKMGLVTAHERQLFCYPID